LDADPLRHPVSGRSRPHPRRRTRAALAGMTSAGTIEVEALRKVFHQTGTGEAVVAIERLDFVVAQGEIVAIVGQTGCGKSTFLNLLIGLDRPTDRRIAIGASTPLDAREHLPGVRAALCAQDR